MLEIASKEPRIEDALKQIVAHNEKDFMPAGFLCSYKKTGDNKYQLTFTFGNPAAKAGMANPLAVKVIIHSMKKQLKNIDKNIEIKRIKEREDKKPTVSY